MNAGFSNLKALKRELLLSADLAKPDWDASIQALGLGVAAMFETYCNRYFNRLVDDTLEATADRYSLVVQRYPIESISKFEIRDSMQDGWEVIPNMPDNFISQAGLVQFFTPAGYFPATMRITYTGGFWWDTSEDGSDVMPVGAFPLREDLRVAWVMQVRWFWERRSIIERAKAGFENTKTQDQGFAATTDDLLLSVRNVLNSYRRFSI